MSPENRSRFYSPFFNLCGTINPRMKNGGKTQTFRTPPTQKRDKTQIYVQLKTKSQLIRKE